MEEYTYIDNKIKASNDYNIDNLTDYGKGISYKAIDGKEYATMEQVDAVSKAFYDVMMIQDDDSLQEKHKHCR